MINDLTTPPQHWCTTKITFLITDEQSMIESMFSSFFHHILLFCILQSSDIMIFWVLFGVFVEVNVTCLTTSTLDNNLVDFPEYISTTREGANILYSAWFLHQERAIGVVNQIWKKHCLFLTNPSCLVAALHSGLFLSPAGVETDVWSLALWIWPTDNKTWCPLLMF